MRCLLVVAVGSLALASSGCLKSTGCDFRDGLVAGSENRCQEATGSLADDSYESTCASSGGDVVAGGCPAEGRIGSCLVLETDDGATLSDVYYAPESVDSATARCRDRGGRFEEAAG